MPVRTVEHSLSRQVESRYSTDLITIDTGLRELLMYLFVDVELILDRLGVRKYEMSVQTHLQLEA